MNGKARRYSDLDLVLKSNTKKAITISSLALLQEELACSDMGIIVDLYDWYAVPECFKETLVKSSVLLKGLP